MTQTKEGFYHNRCKVLEINDSVKCWTTLKFAGGRSVSVKRNYTNRKLLGRLEGHIVDIVSSDNPSGSTGTGIVDSIEYYGQRFYPVSSR